MNKEITDHDFDLLRAFSERWIGIKFDDDKKYLFENRLPTMVRDFEYDDLDALICDLVTQGDRFPYNKKNYFIDLITTHETFFFRDKSPFVIMKELILNDLKNLDAERHIKIHSAACSSGQEPLSIAMLIQEHIDKKNLRLNYHIDAVDISLPCIEKCKKGFYSQYEIQRGLPIKLLNKYFKQYHETFWKFKCQYQKFIDYKQGNILTSKMDADSRHVIFCRNVTIYMNKVNVRKIYEKFHKALKKGGWLIIGHSESMHLHKDLFEMVKFHGAIAYQKRG